VDTSQYQAIKLLIGEYVPIDRDYLHILIGLLLVIIAVLANRYRKRKSTFLLTLTVACAIGASMEFADMFDDISSLGHWRWDESMRDFFRTILFPGMATIYAKFSHRRSNESRD
jgi:hypothetical protein